VVGKDLTRANCNMMKSYFTVIKYNLFDCKPALSIELTIQQDQIKHQQAVLLELKRQLTTLEHLIDNMKKI